MIWRREGESEGAFAARLQSAQDKAEYANWRGQIAAIVEAQAERGQMTDAEKNLKAALEAAGQSFAKDKALLEKTSEFADLELARVGEVLKEREKTHGDAEPGHAILGQLWQAFTLKQTKNGLQARTIGPQEAMFMQLLGKVARVLNTDLKQEHIEDIIGYASLILGTMQRAKTMAQNVKETYDDVRDGPDDIPGTADDPNMLGTAKGMLGAWIDPNGDR